MADQLQLRRGTTSQNLVFTGAQGEIIVDTTKNTVVVHDGITAGGFPLATSKQVTGGTFYYNEDAGSAADAYILVPKINTNTPSSYQDGVQFGFVSAHANTGPATANFQSLGVKSLKYPGGVDPLAGDIFGRVYLIYDAGNDWMEIQRKALGPPPQIRTIGGAVASNALTITLQPCVIDFRASSLGSGAISSLSVTSPLSVIVPAGATLGMINATAGRVVVLAIRGPSGVELAVVNLAGGVNLDETTLINTVAITSGATLANAIYSTTARSGVPFRVVGYIESTQATAGSWATVPSTIQGAGGQAIAAMSSIGYGQTWQNLTGSRLTATTYYNTTGRPIQVSVTNTSTTGGATALTLTVNGGVIAQSFLPPSAGNISVGQVGAIIPPGASYSCVIGGATYVWQEMR